MNSIPNPYEPPRGEQTTTSPWTPASLFGFLISVACGFLMWVMSPILTGEVEPWDSGLFLAWMLGSGFAVGFLIRKPTGVVSAAAPFTGIWLGQLLYVVPSIPGPLWFIAIALFIYSLAFLPSYLLALGVRAVSSGRRN